MAREFVTPVGRLVQGSVWEPQTHDRKTGALLVFKTGAKAGHPSPQYFWAIAVPKTDPDFARFYGTLVDEAKVAFPEWYTNGQMTHPRFSWKVKDGDGIDANGMKNSEKEGFAGHWVITFNGLYAPKCHEYGKYDPASVLTDPNRIKRGYWVRVGGITQSNKPSDIPGLYLNASIVELIYTGQEIVSGPSASELMGKAPTLNLAQLPPGATALGATPAGLNGLPGLSGTQTPGAYVAPALPGTTAIPGTPVTPAGGFVDRAIGGLPGLPGVAPVATPPVKQRVMTPAAMGHPYEEFVKQGFTDESLLQQGFMVWQ